MVKRTAKATKEKILVTGSAGFMGSHLVDYLEDKGHDVYGVDDLSGGFLRNVRNKKKFSKLDLRDRTKTAAYIAKIKPTLIYHLAADATEGRSQFTPFSALDRNLTAYMNLLVPAIRHGMKKMVLTSSMSVYGAQQAPFKEEMEPDPEDVYGTMKAAMERITKIMAEVYGFKYVIARPHNVYGARQNLADPYRNVVGIFINALLRNKPFYIYGDGSQERAFSHVSDVTPIMAEAGLAKAAEGQIINIGSDDNVPVNSLARIVLEEFFGGNIPKKFEPKYLPLRPQEVKFAFCAHDTLSNLMNYRAKVSIRDGVREMITWARTLGAQEVEYLKGMDLDHKDIPKTWTQKLY